MASGAGPVVLDMTPPAATLALHLHNDLDAWLSMPRGGPHAFRVVGHQAARILLVYDNDSFLQLIRDPGQPAGARQPLLPPAVPASGS
jgi:hypothetical protein